MQKILQKFNINGDIKSVSITLAPHFKLRATMTPTTIAEREYKSHVPYYNIVDSLMYVMVGTRPDLSQAVNMVSKYMHDLGEKL